MKIRSLIIDDEKLARMRLQRMLAEYAYIEIVGEAQNGAEGIVRIEALHPELIFLDIQMPGLSGFEMLAKLTKVPYIVFITAYDQYALLAFEENAIDYLLKPVVREKLDRAMEKAVKILQKPVAFNFDLEKLPAFIKSKTNIFKRFSVKVGERIYVIPDKEIYFFHAGDKYTFLITAKDEHIIPFTLKELEDRLDPELFCRVHRSYIVNLEHIASIHKWFVGKLQLKMKNGQEIVVSLNYLDAFKRMIHYN